MTLFRIAQARKTYDYQNDTCQNDNHQNDAQQNDSTVYRP